MAYADLRSLGEPENLPALRTLELYNCLALNDLGTVADLPSLKEVTVHECPALPPDTLAELRSRGLLAQ
ncbi:hypothetical protein ABZ297_01955 [Nonomuraea sp. NPDC005983]|uniref:hypothetical protein n=1 Tax=Nonomuraea sp. NPDC005983 TaxID=3155595 RepID=UPI0033BEEFD3